MSRSRISFTERRRKLALKVDHLDRLENRSTVTPISAALALGAYPAGGQVGGMQATDGSSTPAGSATVSGMAGPEVSRAKSTDAAQLATPGADPIWIRIVPEGGGPGSGGALPDVPAP